MRLKILSDNDIAHKTPRGIGVSVRVLKGACFSNISQPRIDTNIELLLKAQAILTAGQIISWMKTEAKIIGSDIDSDMEGGFGEYLQYELHFDDIDIAELLEEGEEENEGDD